MKGLPYVGSLIVAILISGLTACSGGLFGTEDTSTKPPVVVPTTPPNTIPVAVGRSIVSLAYVGDPITFDATGSSDADAGTVLTYAWNFGDQTPIGSGITVTHTYAVEGIFKVILTVSDGKDSKINELYVTVVQRRNQAPVAAISNYQTYINIEAGTALSVNASGSSDPDGDTLSYEWNFGDGGQNASTAIAQKIYSNPGVFVVRLTVSDGVDEDELAFAVNVATSPEAHSAIILPDGTRTTTAAVKDAVSLGFDGTASLDRDGSIQSWNWNFDDGQSASGGSVSHAYGNPGVYSVVLTVTDNAGKSASAAPLVVTVSATPPVSNAGENQELASDSTSNFILDGTGSNGVGTLTYSWSLVDAAGASITLSSPASPFISLPLSTFTNPDPDLTGPFRAQLIVSDTYGQNSIDSIYLNIININEYDEVVPVGVIKPPAQDQETLDALAELSLALSPSVSSRSISRSLISSRDLSPKVYALVGRPMYFDGTRSYDPGGLQTGLNAGASLLYTWDFGDGDATQPTVGALLGHRFASAGEQLVKLTITDDEVDSTEVTMAVTVIDLPNKPPRADAGVSKTAYIGDSVSFQANSLNTGDADGLIINYAWDFNDGSPVATRTTSAEVTHSYANPGAYLVTLTVTDNGLAQGKIAKSAMDTVSVVVRKRPENTAPVALPGQAQTIIIGESVLLDASASFDPDPAGLIVSYAWKLGGITLSTAVRYIHTFETVGIKNVELTVTDNGGNGNPAKSASATTSITVAEKPPVALMVNISTAQGTEISPAKPMIFKYYEIVDGTEWWKLAPVAERTIEAPGKYGIIVTDFKRPDGSFAWDVSKKFAMKFEHHVSGPENPYWGFLNTGVTGGVSYALPQNGVLAATQLDPASISELIFNDVLASATVSVDAY